jgi:hypothetical protein
MADRATILAVKEPGMRAEWDLYELGQVVLVIDRRKWGQPTRDYPGEGLLAVPGVASDDLRVCLDAIDDQWDRQLEIIDSDKALIDRLLGDTEHHTVRAA